MCLVLGLSVDVVLHIGGGWSLKRTFIRIRRVGSTTNNYIRTLRLLFDGSSCCNLCLSLAVEPI